MGHSWQLCPCPTHRIHKSYLERTSASITRDCQYSQGLHNCKVTYFLMKLQKCSLDDLLSCTIIFRQSGPIHNPSFRQPSPVDILYPPTESSSDSTNVTVRKKENGIHYEWDITKVMFSPGNISEKQRLAQLDLRNSVVVDLFAGIGYFTLTFLVHSRAAFVHACEWNPDAIYWLKNNLKLNKIHPERYAILGGDNKIMAPRGVADHVNLGLIPSSEGSWEAGVAALRRDKGGVLHVHGNVDLHKKSKTKKCHLQNNSYSTNANENCGTPKFWQIWGDYVKNKIMQILKDLYPEEEWLVGVAGIFKVKSYGPRVDHLVVDITCKPCTLAVDY